MKRLFTVLLVSLLCVHIASAQTRATRRSEFRIIDPADTVKIQIKKPGVKVRYNSDGKKLNYMSDSLLIVYSPDSVKQHYDPKKEVYYKMEIFGSECDTSFTYTYTNSKIDIKDTTRFSLSFGKDRTEDGAFSRLDFNVPFYSKVVTKSYGHRYKVEPGNFGMALLNVNSGNPDFKTQRSYEVFLNLCTDDFKLSRSVTFNYGLGFSWKNFAMTKSGMMTKDDDGNILIGGWPEKAEPKVSKLRVFSVTFPLILSVNAYRGVGFSVGPVVNLNASSSAEEQVQEGALQSRHRRCDVPAQFPGCGSLCEIFPDEHHGYRLLAGVQALGHRPDIESLMPQPHTPAPAASREREGRFCARDLGSSLLGVHYIPPEVKVDFRGCCDVES